MYSGEARSSYRQHCWSGRGHLSHEVRMGTRAENGVTVTAVVTADQLSGDHW